MAMKRPPYSEGHQKQIEAAQGLEGIQVEAQEHEPQQNQAEQVQAFAPGWHERGQAGQEQSGHGQAGTNTQGEKETSSHGHAPLRERALDNGVGNGQVTLGQHGCGSGEHVVVAMPDLQTGDGLGDEKPGN